MGKAEKRVLEILRTQPSKQIGLTELSKQVARDGLLGFGVETSDLVFALKNESKVEYDADRDLVKLTKE